MIDKYKIWTVASRASLSNDDSIPSPLSRLLTQEVNGINFLD